MLIHIPDFEDKLPSSKNP